jgi:UDP-N-acetylmuramoyl-tripeptide--D-alanyl-D-alanine ligase
LDRSFLWPWIVRSGRVYRRTLGRRVRVVSVVGSVGKTTTVRAVAAVLGVKVGRPALLNMNSSIGVGRALLGARPWQRHVVIENAIVQPGQMRPQAIMARPDVVVVTAIASDHWRSLPTLETTRDEKAEMVRALKPSGIAILNADDPNVRWMATQTRARVVLIGESEDAEVRASDVAIDWPHGMRFTVHVAGESRPVRIKLLGTHMILPALAAIATAYVEGLSVDAAIATLANLEPTLGRMQTMPLPNGATVIRDDYKASVESVETALDTLKTVPAQRRIVVLGALTEPRGADDYRALGRVVGQIADRAIFVGSSKDMRTYRSGAIAAGLQPEMITRVRDAHEATELLRSELGPNDVVLTKGRWQQALARVGLSLSGVDVQCRADPCPFKRMICDVCPHLEEPFLG